MPNALKMFNRCLQGLPLVLALVAVSCTNVYFEKPVPQSGVPVRGIPAEWAGLYVSEPGPAEAVSELEQIFQQCFRLELLSGTRLLVSQEWRLHENNLDQLRAALEIQKKEGKLIDFQLLGSLILYTMRSESSGQVEQQYVALLRQGEWYILPRTVAPFQLYDLESGLQTQYEQEEPAAPVSEWLPGADTLSSKAVRLVARQHAGGWYFNTQEKEGGKWSLLYVEQPSEGRLVVKVSNLANTDDFQRRSAYFNAITPFNKVEQNRYEIDPADEALARLLAETDLFQTTYLRRIRE